MSFVHTHVHDHYSLLDGYPTPEEFILAAKELGFPAIATTNHGTLSSHREFQKYGLEHGIKPILGCEMYISASDRFDRRTVAARDDNVQLYNHLIVLAKDATGLKNLNVMSEKAWTEGFYYKPRIDKNLLAEHSEGLIVLSGCMNGLISKAIDRDDPEEAREWLEYFERTFGEDFYIEVQPHNPVELNQQLLDYADAYGIKPIVTADCHFAHESDRDVEEVMLILSTHPAEAKNVTYETVKGHKDFFDKINAMYPVRKISFENLDVFLQTREQLEEQMRAKGFDRQDMFDSSLEIGEKIGEYPYPKGLDLLPNPVDEDPDDALHHLAEVGMRKRGLAGKKEYEDRLKIELDVIKSKNFSNYFLIVADVVQWAKSQNIMVGPGRGSAAGSLLCYVLGITAVDPLKYNLLFARFISEERNDYPDIDIDFEDRRRNEVKEYLRKRYPYVAAISTFTYFKDKGVVKDVARVLRVPLNEVNAAMKEVNDWDDFISSPQTKEFRKKYPEVQQYAERMRGRIRGTGMHAAGIVISKEPIENFVPIETRPDPYDKASGRVPAVAVDMKICEEVGLIKFDCLGLTALTVIHDTLDMIKERTGEDIDLEALELNDQKVIQEFGKGNTVGVFQADAGPYTHLLKTMEVLSFDDIVASNALVRPGAMNTVGKIYVDRQKGNETIEYPHDIMRPYLEDTYGVVIYQEQVMFAVNKLAGFTWSEADRLRKIIGKKLDKSEFDPWRNKWLDGASDYISKSQADQLWTDFQAHAGYSFNKSHAVAYSMLSYWTMWLKVYYPLEYSAALMISEKQQDKRTEYLLEAKRLGANVLLPHINASNLETEVQGDALRIGLTDIKFISEKSGKKIIKGRPYKSYKNFLEVKEQKGSGINSRMVDALNAIGAAYFEDNPKRGDEGEHYYEYLGIPKFDSYEWPWHIEEVISSTVDFTEDGNFVFLGMCRDTKRGVSRNGQWCRVELIDSNGTVGLFMNPKLTMDTGQLFFILCSNNRVEHFVPAKEVWEAVNSGQIDHPDPFIKYLINETLEAEPASPYVLSFSRMTTKAKQLMGILVIANKERQLRRVLVFPNQFGSVYNKIKPGQCFKMKQRALGDGAYCYAPITAK